MRHLVRLATLGAFIGLGLPQIAQAHHAMEYILLDGYNTAYQGQALFHLHFDYFVSDVRVSDAVHWEITPGFSYGLTDRVLLDLHAHFSSFGPALTVDHTPHPPFIEALAGSFQVRFGEEGRFPLDPAVVVSFETPSPRAQQLLGSQPGIWGTLVLARSFGPHRGVVLNLTAGGEGESFTWEWGAGFRTPLSPDPHGPGVSVESKGSLGHSPLFLVGVHLPLSGATFLKTGFLWGGEAAEEALGFHISLFTVW